MELSGYTILKYINEAARNANPSVIEILDTHHLKDDNILDSLDESIFFIELEKLLDVKIPAETADDNDLCSVSKLIDYLMSTSRN